MKKSTRRLDGLRNGTIKSLLFVHPADSGGGDSSMGLHFTLERDLLCPAHLHGLSIGSGDLIQYGLLCDIFLQQQQQKPIGPRAGSLHGKWLEEAGVDNDSADSARSFTVKTVRLD